MTTWGILKADLADLLSRYEMDSSLPMYLRMAEARINRDVKCRAMERAGAFDLVEEGVFGAGAVSVDLREQFGSNTIQSVKLVALGVLNGEAKPLTAVSLEELYEQYQHTRGGTPTHFALSTGTSGQPILILAPVPPQSEPLYLTVWAHVRFALDTANDADTNWLLTNHYDLYLNALAATAVSQIQDFERQGMFDVNYKRAVEELKDAENLARVGGSAWGSTLSGANATGGFLP